MNIRNPQQQRLQHLQRHAIDWRHRQYDYRPPAKRESVQAMHRREKQKDLIEAAVAIGLALAIGAVLALGL